MVIYKQYLEAYISDCHDLNTDSNNCLQKYYHFIVFWTNYFQFCVFSKCLSYLTMLQLHSITSLHSITFFNSVCASSKIIKIGHELTSE